MIARNVNLASAEVAQSPPVALLSDPRSAALFKFHRGFGRRDSYAELASVQAALEQPAWAGAGKPLLVLLNMPVLYEEELTGRRYGGEWDPRPDRDAIDAAVSNRCRPIFSANADYGRPIFDSIFGDQWTARLLRAKPPFDMNPTYTQVKLLQCSRR
jgi:hypothetical protein